VEIPQAKDRPISSKARIGSYQVAEAHDVVWVCLAEEPKLPIPDFPELSEGKLHAIPVQVSTGWNTSVVRMILSALDDYHFPWLHEGILGDRSRPEAPKREVGRNGRTLISSFNQIQPTNLTNYQGDGPGTGTTVVNYSMQVDMPSVLRLIKKNENGGTYLVWFAACPREINATTVFWRVLRDYDLGAEEDAKVIEMETLIQSQDIDHVCRQKPWTSPPLPVKGVDEALLAYLQWLKDLGIPTNA
jgi:vanillate O-demethylase monooxygenase subunit